MSTAKKVAIVIGIIIILGSLLNKLILFSSFPMIYGLVYGALATLGEIVGLFGILTFLAGMGLIDCGEGRDCGPDSSQNDSTADKRRPYKKTFDI
jgi:uncharacterized membrane protein YozB (DUF420 family)